MCVFNALCIYVYAGYHIRIHIYTDVYTHIMYACAFTYTQMSARIQCMRVQVCDVCMYAHHHPTESVHMHTNTLYIYIHIYHSTYIYIYIYIYIAGICICVCVYKDSVSVR